MMNIKKTYVDLCYDKLKFHKKCEVMEFFLDLLWLLKLHTPKLLKI